MPSRPFGGSENSVFLKVKSALEASNEGLESNFMAKNFNSNIQFLFSNNKGVTASGTPGRGLKTGSGRVYVLYQTRDVRAPSHYFKTRVT